MRAQDACNLLTRRVFLNAAAALAVLAGVNWLTAPASAQLSIGVGGGGFGIGMSTDAARPTREPAPQHRPRKAKSERAHKEANTKSGDDSPPRKPAADETSFGR